MASRAAGKTNRTLAERIEPALAPRDKARASTWIEDLTSAAAESGARKKMDSLLRDADLAGFVAAVMDHSRFLRSLMLDDPGRLLDLLATDPELALTKSCEAARNSWRLATRTETMAALRHSRAEIALLVGLADLGKSWDAEQAMSALSAFAEAAIRAAASTALLEQHRRGNIVLADPDDDPELGCGWIILAMGKLGAGELNYSSDVDLIALFEPDSAAIPDGGDPGKLYVRLTQSMIAILSEYTDAGYVLRTDMRLRPDPGSTAVAVSVPAALIYYEGHGQNWERAALIKARPVAGDIAAGEAFLDELSPFIWRKYLDYAAIADIHSIKRQIHDHRGHETIAVAGHNLKLGRGGIREIEFFAQTQQLIAGGRNPELRGRKTVAMLDALAEHGWVEPKVAEELTSSYFFLRSLEHRLQMVDDQQTHSLPTDDDDLRSIARLCGATDVTELESQVRPVLQVTQRHYSQLFEDASPLSATLGSLVFTGDEDDPETLQTLAQMGFQNPEMVSGLIRGWHYGRYPATRSSTARERLTEITPSLLDTLAKDNGDAAVISFDRFLAQLPAGVQLFSLMSSNPWMLSLFGDILGAAPRLAEIITRRPHALDAIIDPAFFGGLPDKAALSERLQQTMADAVSFEDALDRLRIFGQEQSLLIGARLIAGTIEPVLAQKAYTDLADVLVGEGLRLALDQIESAHGRMPGGKVALMAMGKFGGREMTAGSDLDLILLYEFTKTTAGSDGDRSLAGGQYFIRLTQRLVAALSAPTAEGTLYEVDLRLRPSGNSGPLATSLDAFAAYQRNEAWTWEHMALTRARLIAGDRTLCAKAERAISEILVRPRKQKRLVADVIEMRGLIEESKGSEDRWDIKQARGGLVDVEFIAQYLQLRHAAKHPDLLSGETDIAIARAAKAGVLTNRHAEELSRALKLYQDLLQTIRLCVGEPFRPEHAPVGLKALLARVAELPDFERVEVELDQRQAAVRGVFEELLGPMGAG